MNGTSSVDWTALVLPLGLKRATTEVISNGVRGAEPKFARAGFGVNGSARAFFIANNSTLVVVLEGVVPVDNPHFAAARVALGIAIGAIAQKVLIFKGVAVAPDEAPEKIVRQIQGRDVGVVVDGEEVAVSLMPSPTGATLKPDLSMSLGPLRFDAIVPMALEQSGFMLVDSTETKGTLWWRAGDDGRPVITQAIADGFANLTKASQRLLSVTTGHADLHVRLHAMQDKNATPVYAMDQMARAIVATDNEKVLGISRAATITPISKPRRAPATKLEHAILARIGPSKKVKTVLDQLAIPDSAIIEAIAKMRKDGLIDIN